MVFTVNLMIMITTSFERRMNIYSLITELRQMSKPKQKGGSIILVRVTRVLQNLSHSQQWRWIGSKLMLKGLSTEASFCQSVYHSGD